MNKFVTTLSLLIIAHSIALTSYSYAAFARQSGGARPVAMGGAFTAVADDSDAIIYNTGGLTQMDKAQASFMYAKLYTGLDGVDLGTNHLTFALPTDAIGCFGLGWTSFSSSNEYQEDALYLSYARDVSKSTTLGINLKYLGHRYILDDRAKLNPVFSSSNSAYRLTADLGVHTIISLPSNSISLGLSAKNITQPDLGLRSSDIVPMEATLGGCYRIGDNIIPSIDLSYRFQEWGTAEDKINIRAGSELWLLNHSLALRSGFNLSEVSLGFGINRILLSSNMELDYAFLVPINIKESSGTHHISLSVKF